MPDEDADNTSCRDATRAEPTEVNQQRTEVVGLTARIKTNYDFRSPYAYFADYRVRKADLGFDKNVEWIGRPILMDVILNLQAGREPWASYLDTLIPPKRAYLMAASVAWLSFMGLPTGHHGSGRPGRTNSGAMRRIVAVGKNIGIPERHLRRLVA